MNRVSTHKSHWRVQRLVVAIVEPQSWIPDIEYYAKEALSWHDKCGLCWLDDVHGVDQDKADLCDGKACDQQVLGEGAKARRGMTWLCDAKGKASVWDDSAR
ncbi:hypothetical protein HAX54_025049 [Datura stramonium]|uniref:Uncharacterized protein n=1 Tax=Datura stramonium TaxID=4076 RepID=A0ABS8V113_DATST|nr:hypothetical protein [Datura stramonium]